MADNNNNSSNNNNTNNSNNNNNNSNVNRNPYPSYDPNSFVATMVSRKRKVHDPSSSSSSTITASHNHGDDFDDDDGEDASWRDVYRNIKCMDKLYDATFYSWLKSEDNVLVTSVYLHRIANEYPLPRIINALKWLISDWRLESISILVRHVTSEWNGFEGDARKSILLRSLTHNWATQYTATLISTLLAHPPYTISSPNSGITNCAPQTPAPFSSSSSFLTLNTTTTAVVSSPSHVASATTPSQPEITPQAQKEHFLKAFTADWDFSKLSEFFMYLQAKANVGYKLKCHMLQEAARRERDVLGGKVLATGRKRNSSSSSSSPALSSSSSSLSRKAGPEAETTAITSSINSSTVGPPVPLTVRSHSSEISPLPSRATTLPSSQAIANRSSAQSFIATTVLTTPPPQPPLTISPSSSPILAPSAPSSSPSSSSSISSTTPIATSSSPTASPHIRHHHRRTSSNDVNELKRLRLASPAESPEPDADAIVSSSSTSSSLSSSASTSQSTAKASMTEQDTSTTQTPSSAGGPTSTTASVAAAAAAAAPSFPFFNTPSALCGPYRCIESVPVADPETNVGNGGGGKDSERAQDGRGVQTQVSAGSGGGKRRMSVGGDS